ncbi:MAG: DM9 repeat-containing protein [Gammaproteobacteria bacterium]
MNGTLHPGKVVDKHCSVGYGGREIMNNQYEILTLPGY